MQQLGFELSRILKQLPNLGGSDRKTRAMLLANAVALQIPFEILLDFNEQQDKAVAKFKKILSKVNENIAVDTKLAVTYFNNILRIRQSLINGITDPCLVKAVLTSDTANDYLTVDDINIVSAVVNDPDYNRIQADMGNALNQLIGSIDE